MPGVDCVAPNVRGLRFNEKQAGYLAGVLAGEMTFTNTIGAVGGMEIPPVVDFLEGYRNGAQCTNTNVNVLSEYSGTFDDPNLGAAIAEGMMTQGADIIFGAAGNTGIGSILFSTQNGQWAIGVDTDQYISVFGDGTVFGSNNLLSSAMKRTDQAVYQTIEDYVNGAFTSGTVRYDLSMDGVGLAPFHETDSIIPQQVRDKLELVRQGIIAGIINVDFPCSPPPMIAVSLTQHWIMAGNFPPDTPMTFTVYQNYGDISPVRVLDWYSTDSSGNLSTQGWELGWDFVPGNYLVASGGGITKELILENVTLDVFDPELDLISGTCIPLRKEG